MTANHDLSPAIRWARFRFSVIGPLLSAPPARGQLRRAIRALAETSWLHPISGEPVQFAAATIEGWYYKARKERDDPLRVLKQARRKDAGQVTLDANIADYLRAQYRDHPHWSVQLHYDNLRALVAANPQLGTLASYSTIRRYLQAHGLLRKRRPRERKPGEVRAERRRQSREVRSYEAEYVGSLWHLDFHHASLRVVTSSGQWQRPIALGILDDHSRLCCHLQWYLAETTEDLVHGFSQAIQKRGLPRALMTDNGPAMIADEFTTGLMQLSIVHEKTLPYSPYQNGKQEAFWATLEGRLIEMLRGCAELTLGFLNQATQAWVEQEYHSTTHREIASSPLERFRNARDVLRASPSSGALRDAFRLETQRRQRLSDGTISLAGKRFEIPARYRHFRTLRVRYARWDLGHVDLVDPHSGTILAPIYPLDRQANADGNRSVFPESPDEPDSDDEDPPAKSLPPLLKRLLDEAAASGSPPAYLPKTPPNTSQPGEAS